MQARNVVDAKPLSLRRYGPPRIYPGRGKLSAEIRLLVLGNAPSCHSEVSGERQAGPDQECEK